MRILKLEVLDRYYRKNRRVGHTVALLDGAKSNKDIILLVAHNRQGDCIDLSKDQIISINCLDKLKGITKPVMVDHFALQLMFSEVRGELLKKDERIDKLEKKIKYYQKMCNY